MEVGVVLGRSLAMAVLTFSLALTDRDGLAQELPPTSVFDGEFFSLEIPHGWQIYLGGHCSLFSFVVRDPTRPARQVFYFGGVGPITLSQQQRAIDLQYMQNGGFDVPQAQFPVLDPPTPTNFLAIWPYIAQTQIAADFLPARPFMQSFAPTAEIEISTPAAEIGGVAGLVRGLFLEGNELAEGLFSLTLVPEVPFMNGPGGHTGRAVWFTGITAPKREFAALEPHLAAIAASFRVSETYVQKCRSEAQSQWDGVMQAGETLRESAEIVNGWWRDRQTSDDIRIEQQADAILGVERLYDPETDQVYEFPNGFSDTYNLDPGKYRMPNLQPLGVDDHRKWIQAPLNGPRAME
jgi:hypothetical protein